MFWMYGQLKVAHVIKHETYFYESRYSDIKYAHDEPKNMKHIPQSVQTCHFILLALAELLENQMGIVWINLHVYRVRAWVSMLVREK